MNFGGLQCIPNPCLGPPPPIIATPAQAYTYGQTVPDFSERGGGGVARYKFYFVFDVGPTPEKKKNVNRRADPSKSKVNLKLGL